MAPTAAFRTSGETRLIMRHAATVWIGQVAVMAFGVTDTIVAGHYAQDALSALSVGSAIFITVYISLMGVLQALLPVWAELHGAQRSADVGRAARQSLYLCAATSIAGMALLLFPGALLRWTDVPEPMRAQVTVYLRILAYTLPSALLFRLFSTLNQSLGHPRLVTVLQIAALVPKVLLSIALTFGLEINGIRLPALGLVGCGWATLIVNYAMLIAALWLLRTQPIYRAYAIWQRIEAPDWQQIGHFLRLGIPGGLTVLVEVTSFTLMALFIARLGNTATAAHQIVANLTGLAYMTPLSLAIATSARVSFWLGAGNPARARQTCTRGFALALGFTLLYCALMVALRHILPGIYTDDPGVQAIAATLLLATAAYHLADEVQTLSVFVLRSYRITVLPLVIYCALLWGVGLTGGYLLAYRGLGPWAALHTPLAFWLMAALALILAALLLVALLLHTLRRGRGATQRQRGIVR
ncbi:MAG: MATE family efflux transporter [Burkholderiaceae bacterium]|jgi:MATE family multidrug resistance protein|nr:MATE family efflux transporter [Burkholderiaceae bacterium]